ncbi:MAG: hypothetical protein ABII90_12245 [Bacteroidota bacterium]
MNCIKKIIFVVCIMALFSGLFSACTSSGGGNTASTLPNISSYYAIPDEIFPGDFSQLHWEIENANYASIDNGVNIIDPVQGDYIVYPEETTTYTLTAVNSNGSVSLGVEVTVLPSPDLPTIDDFSCDPVSINVGENSILHWSVQNATSITIEYIDDEVVDLDTPFGYKMVYPTVTTTYTLTATNDNGSVDANLTVTIRVENDPPTVNYFYTSDYNIVAGDPTTLVWATTLADTVEIDHNGGSDLDPSGSVAVYPTTTTTYTITATNSYGTDTKSLEITVSEPLEPPEIISFYASPSAILLGSSTTLTWEVTGATSLDITNIDETVTPVDVGIITDDPSVTTTYSLIAINSAGYDIRDVTVTVAEITPNPPTINSFACTEINGEAISATDTVTINEGDSITLSWSITDADIANIDPGIGSVANSLGTKIITPSDDTTYILRATNIDGSVTDTVTVTIIPAGEPPEIILFGASPTEISAGGSTTLHYETLGATTLHINNGVGTINTNLDTGGVTIHPTISLEYTLTATNSDGTTTATADVIVNGYVEDSEWELFLGPKEGCGSTNCEMWNSFSVDGDHMYVVLNHALSNPAGKPYFWYDRCDLLNDDLYCVSRDGNAITIKWSAAEEATSSITGNWYVYRRDVSNFKMMDEASGCDSTSCNNMFAGFDLSADYYYYVFQSNILSGYARWFTHCYVGSMNGDDQLSCKSADGKTVTIKKSGSMTSSVNFYGTWTMFAEPITDYLYVGPTTGCGSTSCEMWSSDGDGFNLGGHFLYRLLQTDDAAVRWFNHCTGYWYTSPQMALTCKSLYENEVSIRPNSTETASMTINATWQLYRWPMCSYIDEYEWNTFSSFATSNYFQVADIEADSFGNFTVSNLGLCPGENDLYYVDLSQVVPEGDEQELSYTINLECPTLSNFVITVYAGDYGTLGTETSSSGSAVIYLSDYDLDTYSGIYILVEGENLDDQGFYSLHAINTDY